MTGSDWVKTSDRIPTDDDGIQWAGGDKAVVAITKYAHGYFPEVKPVSDVTTPKYYPYWLPLPPWPGMEP